MGKKTFSEYVTSNQFDGNWVVRNLCAIKNNAPVTDADYEKCCELLDGFLSDDYTRADLLIDKVSELCYGSPYDKPRHGISKNSSGVHITPLHSTLSPDVQAIFLDKTKYDLKLSNKYGYPATTYT
jgi:hypothetical protein